MKQRAMSDLPIYLDYMATTPVDPYVIEAMLPFLGFDGVFGNPASSTHVYGQRAAQAVDRAREQIAAVIHASPRELVFTSGATEANNLALLGAARFYQSKGKHLISMSTEHRSVLDALKQLEREGFEVTYLSPEPSGLLDLKRLEAALRPDSILVSIMHVNNETGVIQDVQAISALLRGRGIIFHVDAAQSAGKLALDLSDLDVSLMSFSAHKNYGPKGIGALYVRQNPRVRLCALTYGGGHESGLRSGTLATHQIVGMGAAFHRAEALRLSEDDRLFALREKLWRGIKDLPQIQLNGDLQRRIPGILNVSFGGYEGENLLLSLKELALSSSSACSALSVHPSYVLKAYGCSELLALNAIRLSLGRFTQDLDVDRAIDVIRSNI